MNDYNLDPVRLIVHHSNTGRRRVLHDTLHGAGFRTIFTTRSIEKLRDDLQSTQPDMLVVDADGDLEGTTAVLRDIRHRRLGENPYVVILAATWTSEERTVIAFLNAGADDIVAMPASVNMFSGRVDRMIEQRKKFIVSAGYIGPDRSRYRRKFQDELGTISVPNGLRHKATGDVSAAVDPEQLKRVNKIVDEHRLRRAALRFDEVLAELEAHAMSEEVAPPPRGTLWQLTEHGQTIADLVKKDHPDLFELASSLLSVVRAITTFADAPANVYALGRVHGHALLAKLRGADDAEGMIVAALQQATAVVGAKSFDDLHAANK